LPLVASLSLRGIGYPQGTIEVSTIHFMASSSPGLAWRNFHGNLKLRVETGLVSIATKQHLLRASPASFRQ